MILLVFLQFLFVSSFILANITLRMHVQFVSTKVPLMYCMVVAFVTFKFVNSAVLFKFS